LCPLHAMDEKELLRQELVAGLQPESTCASSPLI
jgi:hypothetical protein